jgi:hypothetical protein
VVRHPRKPYPWLDDRRFSTIAALACLFCGGCGFTPCPNYFWRIPADRAIQEDNIRESVFRYRIEPWQGNGPFLLSVDRKDPNDAFMARFATLNGTVKKASASYFKEGWLRDRSTDEKAVAFSVDSICWRSLDRVEVRGGMYCGGLCADGGIYRLRRKNGRWVVEEYERQWDS